MEAERVKEVLNYVDPEQVIKVCQELVRFPTPSWEEGLMADFIAEYFTGLGIETRMVEVPDPFGSGKVSRQPVGVIRGNGTGPSLMFNGHMDHNPLTGTREEWDRDPYSGDRDDEYIYGRGSIDEKAGVAGLIAAAEAIKKWGIPLKGDLLLCPVMGHKLGAVGTLHNMRQGITADLVINTETTNLGVITVGVGVIRVEAKFKGRPVHFSSPDHLKDQAAFSVHQMAEFICRLGPDVRPIQPGGWLTFELEPDLPGYPQLSVDGIQSQKIPTNYTTLDLQIRLVPGQDKETVRRDLEGLVTSMASEAPFIDASFEVPPLGGWDWPPYRIAKDHMLPTTVARWHEFVSGKPADVGCGPRLGAVGDANHLANAGIPSIQYGPGDIGAYDVWPAINEKLKIEDLLIGARTMALSAAEICGV